MIKLKYDLIGAYNKGEERHPQEVIISLGMEVLEYVGQPLGDYIEIKVTESIENLPSFITEKK